MRLGEFFNEVCRRVDTEGTAINAVETKRALLVAGDLLREGMECGWAFGLLEQWTRPINPGQFEPIVGKAKRAKPK